MSNRILVVGSVALDTVHTPAESVYDVLGGSAVHFAVAAGHFEPVSLMGVVGPDFPAEYRARLEGRGIDLTGLDVAEGPSFRWEACYGEDWNSRDTIRRELEIHHAWTPTVPASLRGCPYVFLATDLPSLQGAVLDQLSGAPYVMVDTMDYFITNHRPELDALLGRVQAVCVNEQEALLLAGSDARGSLVHAARAIALRGPDIVVIKRGSHGVLLFYNNDWLLLPALPLDTVIDPTGAGDSFAGGLLGWMAKSEDLSPDDMRHAVACGSATASICCECFSVDGLENATCVDIDARIERLRNLSQFTSIPPRLYKDTIL
jgi:sugar/nucleoside kinase (ribokinase family)